MFLIRTATAAFLALGTLAACTNDPKEEEQKPSFDASGTYSATAADFVAGPVRMYTRQGEVKDVQLIQRFSQRWYGGLLYGSPGPVAPFAAVDLTFTTPRPANTPIQGSLKLTTAANTTYSGVYAAAQSAEHLVLADNVAQSDFMPLFADRCRLFTKEVLGLTPTYSWSPLPGSTGYAERLEYHPLYVLELNGAQARMALLSYIFVSGTNGQSCSIGYRNAFNIVNETTLSRLNVGDTLVVQHNQLPLTKQK
ncbi:hypothetical protein F0P96_12685 [Hymenobacter busanensis]|uniref:Uncharacterized protein n=1 Tax=Hymenobacter busanensis TaxID=2607656 RepID=A0A7L4ZWW0_9BACT|nr:hypothetical protein [Hymenobacter busanensis]KAA9332328.1 hypothetical protein F0P96_12685 [Hymenobacter busanensis]QHJ07335.1 hypothetical protein GUY19_08590 [Hymenobacter busanensis]